MKRSSAFYHDEWEDDDEPRHTDEPRQSWVRAGWALVVVIVVVGLLSAAISLDWFGDDERSNPVRSSSSEQPRPAATVAATSVPSAVDRATDLSTELPPTVSASVVAAPSTAPASPASASTESSAPQSSVNSPSAPSMPNDPGASVVAILYSGSIKVSGVVPTQAAADSVVSFVMDCSRSPAWIVRDLNVDPSAPAVSLRLVDLTTPVFAHGSSAVEPGHALELDHIGSLLRSMPAVSVALIGHLDRDRTVQPFYDLGDARAQAVVDYLSGAGVAPERLSMISRETVGTPGGEDSELAVALLGRTEFIFSGLASS